MIAPPKTRLIPSSDDVVIRLLQAERQTVLAQLVSDYNIKINHAFAEKDMIAYLRALNEYRTRKVAILVRFAGLQKIEEQQAASMTPASSTVQLPPISVPGVHRKKLEHCFVRKK